MSKMCAKRPRVLKPTESQIAIAFVEFVERKYPHLAQDLIKIDNENKCSLREGALKKRMGKRKGASDYFFARPRDKHVFHVDGDHEEIQHYNGLWIEVKSAKGKESLEQRAFGASRIQNGYRYACCYGLDQCIRAFEDYIK